MTESSFVIDIIDVSRVLFVFALVVDSSNLLNIFQLIYSVLNELKTAKNTADDDF